MSKNSIKIDPVKFRDLLEKTTGKKISEIAKENGFSRNLISEACRVKKASPVVQNIARLYGIAPEAYMIKDPEPPTNDRKQMSIDDFNFWDRESLKALIKEAFVETLNSLTWSLDTKTNTVTFITDKEAI